MKKDNKEHAQRGEVYVPSPYSDLLIPQPLLLHRRRRGARTSNAKTNSPLSSPLRKESKNEQFYLPFSMPLGQGHNITT
jgi:hypothetical protein